MMSSTLARSHQSTSVTSSLPVTSGQFSDQSIAFAQPSEDVLERIALFCIVPAESSRAYYAPQLAGTTADSGYQVWVMLCDQLTRKRASMQQCTWQRSFALSNKTRWLQIAEKEVSELSFTEMAEIVNLTSLALKHGHFSEVDESLKIADARKMCPDAITAVLRTLCYAKDSLPHWKLFVQEAKAEMLRRGEPEDLMAGLI